MNVLFLHFWSSKTAWRLCVIHVGPNWITASERQIGPIQRKGPSPILGEPRKIPCQHKLHALRTTFRLPWRLQLHILSPENWNASRTRDTVFTKSIIGYRAAPPNRGMPAEPDVRVPDESPDACTPPSPCNRIKRASPAHPPLSTTFLKGK